MSVTFDFSGRSALVTGGGRGIGGAIAAGLAEAGAQVWLVDVDPSAEAVAAKLGGHAVLGDLADPELPERAVREVVAAAGHLDLLVTAAGMQVRTAGADISEADWLRLSDINLGATYRTFRAALPCMTEPGAAALAISSMSADRAIAGVVPYGATKAAVSQLVKGLAVEQGPRGVRINGLAPGYVETAMTGPLLADADRSARIRERICLGHRIAGPADMTGPALFLLSAAAGYMTGQILAVDGGFALS